MTKTRIAYLAGLALCAAAQQPAFEVASIKPANYQGGPLRVTAHVDPDGINFTNVTLRNCIRRAYGVNPYQFTGPDWTGSERFTIVAKAGGAKPEAELMRMLQTLLTERFKLAFHIEKKDMPAYSLVVGKNGPKFKEATGEGATQIDGVGDDGVGFERASMDQLVSALKPAVDRPVFNETRLTGLYTFKLRWDREGKRRADSPEPGDAPSIFTAVQEQLGLKLESRKAPVEILVIDRAEKPSEN